MKNKFNVPLVRLFGIIALAAVIVFSMAACPGDDDGNGNGNGGGGGTGGGGYTSVYTITFNFVGFDNSTPDIELWYGTKQAPHNETYLNITKNGNVFTITAGDSRAVTGSIYFVLYPTGNTHAYGDDDLTITQSNRA